MIDELKKTWQQEDEPKNEQQLRAMTQQRVFSTFRRVKLRAVLESVALLLALLVFFTGLDAHQNALWVNVLLAATLLVGMLNNGILYRRMAVNTQGVNLITALQQTHRRLQWQVGFSVLFSVLLFVGVFAFLLLRVPMTDQKLLLVLFMLPASIGIRSWFDVRQWQRSMAFVRNSLAELRGE